MMEKRRRDRINTSLSQLKNLVLEAMNKDVSRNKFLKKILKNLNFVPKKRVPKKTVL